MQTNEIKLVITGPSLRNWPVAIGLGFLAVLTGVVLFAFMAFPVRGAGLLACFGLGCWAWPAFRASNTEYFVTNLRVIARWGLFSKREAALALADIRDVQVARTPLQELLGIGSVRVRGSSATLVLEGIDEPDEVGRRILSLK